MDEREINQLFSQFNHMRAIVIGDVMVDTYLWGDVERVSPEAPIPIVSVTHRESRMGGAANVSLNIQSLGAIPILFSVIGDDENGRKLTEMMRAKKLSEGGIFIDPERVTTVKNRIFGKGQHIARVDEETTQFISRALEKKLIRGIQSELGTNRVDVIIFVDYDKGVITPSLFQAVKGLAREKGIPVAVDPKRRNFSCYQGVDLFKPNFKEFAEGTGLPLRKGDFDALRSAAVALKEKQHIKLVFITLSELGVFISNGDSEQYYPAVIRHIADVSGAGDTVISLASLAMAAKLPPAAMARLSNIAGGMVCEHPGVVPVNKNQLIQVMKSQNL